MLLSPVAGSAETVSHGIFADLLQRFVTDGVVDCGVFKREEDRLDRYLELLEKTDVGRLGKNAAFAFYANAYNAWTIKLILTAYP